MCILLNIFYGANGVCARVSASRTTECPLVKRISGFSKGTLKCIKTGPRDWICDLSFLCIINFLIDDHFVVFFFVFASTLRNLEHLVILHLFMENWFYVA